MLDILCGYDNTKIIAVARHTEHIPVIENKVYPLAIDVSSKEGIDRLFQSAIGILGHIDVFIANAGFAYLEKLTAPDWLHIEKIYHLNVFSPVYSLEKLIAISGDKPVCFACTVSGAGLVSLPAYSLYCSTKAALHHFIQTYRYEQKKTLQITAVYPVATKTDFFDKATGEKETPLPFPSQNAKIVAKKIIRGIEKGKKRVYPSVLFRLFYPIGRAFPFMLKIYSSMEKRKVKKWLDK